ncbi:MAG: type II toxin-antitoxin system RelE/ParE family toxin [Smithella sp.]|nr:type II toxin-antitoxin system RelE/ParE family toxin [Smithella sp.]
MSRTWDIIYYETKDGRCPVKEFIDSRGVSNRAKIFNWLKQLETHGPNLPRPYADLLTDGIHELRIKLSGDQVRIIYFFCYRDFIILTHAFTKSTDRVPEGEIRMAIQYREDFLKRHDEKELRSK